MLLQPTIDAAPATTPEEEDVAEDFEVIIDQPHFCVVRTGQFFVGEIHTPCDLTDLAWQLAGHGYVMEEMIAFHDGVIEILLRPLGEVPVDSPEQEQKAYADINRHLKEKESHYA